MAFRQHFSKISEGTRAFEYQNVKQGQRLVEEERKEGLQRSSTKAELSNTSVWERLY